MGSLMSTAFAGVSLAHFLLSLLTRADSPPVCACCVQERLECSECHGVRYSTVNSSEISVPIPLPEPLPTPLTDGDSKKGKEEKEKVGHPLHPSDRPVHTVSSR